MTLRERGWRWLLCGPALLYLLIFAVLPALIMVAAAFRLPGDYGGLLPIREFASDGRVIWNLSLDSFQRLCEESVYLRLFLKSLAYAALTTLICLCLAYPLALLIGRAQKSRRNLLILLVVLPFWSNFLIRIYAWMILLGPQSYLSRAANALLVWLGFAPQNLLFSPFAVVLVLVYVHLPFMVLPLYATLEKHDPLLLDAAQDLGASQWQRFWRITWPLSLPGVYAGAALVFIPSLGIFAVPDLVGGVNGIMIGNVIKQQFLDSRDWPFGAALSLMLTLAVLLLAWIAARLARRRYG